MSIDLILEQVLNGIIAGAMYALVGGGLSLVYGTTRVLNFAHGEFFMVVGYALFLLISAASLPPAAAAVLAVIFVTLLAAPFEMLLIRPLLNKPGWEFSTMVTTLGMSIVLQDAALKTLGQNYQTVPYYLNGSIAIGNVQLPLQRVLIFVVAMAALLMMAALMKYSRLGRAVRATSQDRDAASVVGIPVNAIYTIAFALSGALAGVAAVMLAPIQAVSPWMGGPIALKGFVVAVLGGMGNFRGTVAAGLLLGIVEALGVGFTSSEWREVFSFALLAVAVWFRPEGLFETGARRA